MSGATTNDAATIALAALTAILSDERRAERFLALTGLDAETLRQRLDQPSLLSAVIAFLDNHEPDLLAVAAAIDVSPAAVLQAGRELDR